MQKVNWDTFTFRSSMVGYLMTNPKVKSNNQKLEEAMISYKEKISKYSETKNKETITASKLLESCEKIKLEIERLELVKDEPNLSQTCITKLGEIYTEVTSGRTKDVKSKFFEKGNMMEEDAITAYSIFTKEFFSKNKIRRKNEFVEGELDFENNEMSIDTKVSWDIFTFDANAFKQINPIYEWQGHCYMWLFNKKKHRVAYTLLNTPKKLLEAEEAKLVYELFGNYQNLEFATEYEKGIFKEALAELRFKHNYDDLPLERKIRIFEFDRNEEKIELIKKRVTECRNYLTNFTKIKNQEDE